MTSIPQTFDLEITGSEGLAGESEAWVIESGAMTGFDSSSTKYSPPRVIQDDLASGWDDKARILGYTHEQIPVRSLRIGTFIGGLGLLLGLGLMTLQIPLGLIIVFITLGCVGISAYAFWMETGIEIISPKMLIAFILGIFGIAMSSLVAFLFAR